ncbi:zinc finger protein 354A [Elysia marginata]|uniref:Zinc finger protein 354A n=1 Tax=Elysia marginata TaxID=1093978 RepID=A0AAV4EEA8_9GAST|nr:zinc finger protein 354A [Elysia marginata]
MQNSFKQDGGQLLSPTICLIHAEVKALYTALLQALMDLTAFQNEFKAAKSFLGSSQEFQQSLLEFMLTKLKFGCTQVSQAKVKVTGVREDLKMLLAQSCTSASNSFSTKATASNNLSTQATAINNMFSRATAINNLSTHAAASNNLSTQATASNNMSTQATASNNMFTHATATSNLSTQATASNNMFTRAAATSNLSTQATASNNLSTRAAASNKLSTQATATNNLSTQFTASKILSTLASLSNNQSSHATARNNLSTPASSVLEVKEDIEDDHESCEETPQLSSQVIVTVIQMSRKDIKEAEYTQSLNEVSATSQQIQTSKDSADKSHSHCNHMQKYHPEKKHFIQATSREKFDDLEEFQKYEKAHKEPRLLRCDLCNDVMVTQSYLLSHMESHNVEKPPSLRPLKGGVCRKNHRSSQLLSSCNHRKPSRRASTARRASTGKRKYQTGLRCQTCGKQFASKDLISKSEGEQSSTGGGSVAPITVEGNNTKFCEHKDVRKVFYCSFCPQFYHSVGSICHHMNTVHMGEKRSSCETCGEKFFNSLERKKHEYVKHGGEFPGLKCKICGKMCRSVMGRESHYLKHTAEERAAHNVVIAMAICDICGMSMRRKALPHHRREHLSFKCEVCGKEVKGRNALYQHMQIHRKAEGRPQRSVTQPVKERDTESGETYECNICSKTFLTRTGFIAHKVVHTKEKPFRCNICGLAFSFASNLNRHNILHTGQKPFQCNICGKGFSQKVTLDIHRRVHTGEKPYLCNHCGKRFSDPSTLYKHKAIHKKDLT